MKKVVLAYSGGLDTSIIIPWLKENYNCQVIAMVADLGQGDELNMIEEKAVKSGASKVYVLDARKRFVEEYIFPAIKAGAIYEGRYLLGTSLARPLIAQLLVEVAEKEGAEAVAHGATGKGNDQVRFELGVKALNPRLKIIAPWREWNITSRDEAIDYANARSIPVPVTKERPYSMDRNLLHLSHEGGLLEDPANEMPADVLMLTVQPEKAPDNPTYLEIYFESGVPKKINGIEHDPVSLLEKLNFIGGANGIGVVDMVENRLVGIKSRGVYETPGGTLLFIAHRELESLCLDRMTMHFKEIVALRYSELVYEGVWFAPIKEALDAFVENTQKTVTGTVRLKLYKGNCTPAGAVSTYSLYDPELATFGRDQVYNQADATGFINIFGLPLKVRALMEEKAGLKNGKK